jgi:hypothetical protein
MRNILITALAISAFGGIAAAQINAPNPPDLHPSGSLQWPRDDSYAYLRGHGIDKDEATIITESLAPQGKRATPGLFNPNASVPSASSVAGRVPEYGYMPSTWTGTWDEWMKHQDMCSAKYRTYDRTTDLYFYRIGEKQYCNAGLKTAR